MRWFSEHSSETINPFLSFETVHGVPSVSILQTQRCVEQTRWTSLSLSFLSFVFIAMFITVSPNNITIKTEYYCIYNSYFI